MNFDLVQRSPALDTVGRDAHGRGCRARIVADRGRGAGCGLRCDDHVDSERRGDAIHIRASAVLNADTATAWQVLTDYDRYPEFIPDLRTSRVVARRGANVTVEQSGDAALWLFKWPLDITFEINELPPNGLRSRAVAGSLRALASSYTLTTVASGVRLDYEGDIAPGFEFFGDFEQIAVRQNAARQFQALADEIERKGTATPRAQRRRGALNCPATRDSDCGQRLPGRFEHRRWSGGDLP